MWSLPADSVEVADFSAGEDDAFRGEERALHRFTSAVTAEPAAGGNHAVAGDVRPTALAHDVADRAGGARAARAFRDIAVRGDAARRNAPHHGQHARGEIRGHASTDRHEGQRI